MDKKRQTKEKELNLHRLTFTLPQEVFDQMNKLAKIHRRSTTQEMIMALEEYIFLKTFLKE